MKCELQYQRVRWLHVGALHNPNSSICTYVGDAFIEYTRPPLSSVHKEHMHTALPTHTTPLLCTSLTYPQYVYIHR